MTVCLRVRDKGGPGRLHGPVSILFFETQKPTQTLHKDKFSYRTIASPAQGSYREKGSRFLAYAYPVNNEVAIREHLATLEKKYFDARHQCYAWMLGTDKTSFRAFDDGEPNHSAGDPILGQIRSRDLTNLLVVVVRYFGGIKLGVGGLASAYKSAAEDALNHAMIIVKEIGLSISLIYDYAATPEVMRLVKEFDLHIIAQKFEAECELVGHYRLRDKEKLFERMELLIARGVKVRYESAQK
jgi:uncharacterized YigZ family protein